MQVFVVTTSTGIWSVADSLERAKTEARQARETERNVQITECGVLEGGESNE